MFFFQVKQMTSAQEPLMDVAYTMREPVGANSYTWSSRGPAYVHKEICFHSFTTRMKWLSQIGYLLSANCVLVQ
jgi:hypothetical protein